MSHGDAGVQRIEEEARKDRDPLPGRHKCLVHVAIVHPEGDARFEAGGGAEPIDELERRALGPEVRQHPFLACEIRGA